MLRIILITVLGLTIGQFASADCQYTSTTGVGYYGAKQNCDVILHGQTSNCQPEGTGPDALWSCQCTYNCSSDNGGGRQGGGNVTTTTGVGYYGAKQNCEVILRGRSFNCQPEGPDANSLWTCQCSY